MRLRENEVLNSDTANYKQSLLLLQWALSFFKQTFVRILLQRRGEVRLLASGVMQIEVQPWHVFREPNQHGP